MTLSDKVQSLAAREAAEADKKREADAKKAEQIQQAAEDFDSVGCAMLPKFILPRTSAGPDYGPSFHFDAMIPGDILTLLAAFPPMPVYLYRDGARNESYLSIAPEPKEARYTQEREGDGACMKLSGGHGYGQQARVSWHSAINGRVYGFDVDMKPAGYTPRIQARAVRRGDGSFIRYEGADSLVFPLGEPAGLLFRRYGRGTDTALQSFHVYAGVEKYLDACAEWCDKQASDSRAAWAPFSAIVPRAATPEEIAAHAEPYARERLRAGTLAQAATMATPEFRSLLAAVQQNWSVFALCNGLSEGRGYFDHYAFTLWYLGACGMNPDPDAGYKYGSAWL